MSKKNKIILIILLSLALLIIIGFVAMSIIVKNGVFNRNITNENDIGKMNEYSCSMTNGSIGKYEYFSIKKYGEKQAIISKHSADGYDIIPDTEEYLVDIGVLEEIKEIYISNDINKWVEQPESDEVLDGAPSSNWYFGFENGRTNFYSSQKYPKNFNDVISSIDNIIDKYISEGEKLPGLKYISEYENILDLSSIVKGQIDFVAYSYHGNNLSVIVLNGTSKDIEDIQEYELFKISENGEKELIQSGRISFLTSISSMSVEEILINFDMLLDEGKYVVSFTDEFSFEFEIE